MEIASLPNLLSVAAQIGCIAIMAGLAISLLRITAPDLSYFLWRIVLVVCLAVPWMQTPQTRVELAAETLFADVATSIGPARPTSGPSAFTIDWTFVVTAILVGGALLRLAWVAVGLLRLRRFRASGDPMVDDDHAELQQVLGTCADVRFVEALPQPAAFGARRPVVLLPAPLRDQPAATRYAVLAHELVHVARRDWCWLVVEEVVRSILWFHPAIWWVISRIQLAREEVVDATAVRITGSRRDYVNALLAFADDVPLATAPAFARRRHLFRRIVLLSTEDVMSARRIVASAMALGLILAIGAWTAVAAFPTQATVSELFGVQPGPVEQRAQSTTPDNPIPAVMHAEPAVFPAGIADANTAVTVTLRTIVDETGHVAEVRLANFALKVDGFAATISGGPESLAQFEQFLETATARGGTTTTQTSASVLRPVLEAFIESAATAVRQSRYDAPRNGPIVFNTVTHFSSNPRVAASRTVPVVQRLSAEGALRVGNGIKPPVKITDVRPVYPQPARDAGVQGVVIVEARIEPDGHIGSAQILRSIPMLDQAALDAVYQWEFTPTILNGVPTAVIMTMTIQFTLN
jgi:TonB family protein